jgi:hypothetical protein
MSSEFVITGKGDPLKADAFEAMEKSFQTEVMVQLHKILYE